MVGFAGHFFKDPPTRFIGVQVASGAQVMEKMLIQGQQIVIQFSEAAADRAFGHRQSKLRQLLELAGDRYLGLIFVQQELDPGGHREFAFGDQFRRDRRGDEFGAGTFAPLPITLAAMATDVSPDRHLNFLGIFGQAGTPFIDR